MKNESFNKITYSDPTRFENTGGRIALKEFSDDVIFYIPFCAENDVLLTAKPNRDIDPVYRSEIGHLFQGIYKAWEKTGSRFFDTNDCPAFIPLYGNRQERLALLSMYINDKGEFYGESDSLISDHVQQEFLRKNLT